VVSWWRKYPADWKQTWFETERKWAQDRGCPDGVFVDFNIDAKINAAYIVIGLLYGQGDFSKTLEISARCGQDSDCNPASAGGILGTMVGYASIPEFWRKGIYPVEEMDFRYTTLSLNDVYEIGLRHALKTLESNGVRTDGVNMVVPVQEITTVAVEKCFEGHFPVLRKRIGKSLETKDQELEVVFEGNGFVLTGAVQRTRPDEKSDTVLVLEMVTDNGPSETIRMPYSHTRRRLEIGWKYQLSQGKHAVKFKLTGPVEGYRVSAGDLLVYSSKEVKNAWKQAE